VGHAAGSGATAERPMPGREKQPAHATDRPALRDEQSARVAVSRAPVGGVCTRAGRCREAGLVAALPGIWDGVPARAA